ncbi:hypothetical protein K470DRAFT_257447 [Piedraia hortae CBS 480.64]|uniref:Lytic polysaccharide monooxygenase n=1 Tax=Piedraia hortae CBS 480.64 TaxID=1314780 RepID=A0A6A7C1L3_9PEZI|nr:hypothetical protein K470DRAFT_257447 [Piedraia hortae CBS 480.64]
MFSSLLTFLACYATATLASPITPRQANATTPFCSGKSSGLYKPAEGAILSQYISDSECNNFEILYCSGQYFKTSSLDLSVWLSPRFSSSPYQAMRSGQLLAKNVKPDDKDSAAGYYSYRFNVSICPIEGEYRTGPYILSAYETYSGQPALPYVSKPTANISLQVTTSHWIIPFPARMYQWPPLAHRHVTNPDVNHM